MTHAKKKINLDKEIKSSGLTNNDRWAHIFKILQDKQTKKGQKTDFHLGELPGGKALDTEGLREASSVGRGQEPGSECRG